MIVPILPSLFTDPKSSEFLLHSINPSWWYFIAGATTGLFGIMQFIFAPILGEFSDKVGRKPVLLGCIAVLIIANTLFAISILIHSFTLAIFSRAIAGISSANFSVAGAVIADSTTFKNRTSNFGIIGMAFGAGFVLGPALCSLLVSITGSSSVPFFFAGGFGLLNLYWVQTMLPETNLHPKDRNNSSLFPGITSIKKAVINKTLRPVYLCSFFFFIPFIFISTFSTFFLTDKFNLNQKELGIYFTTVGVAMILTQGFLLRIVTKITSEYTLICISLLAFCLSLIFFPHMPTLHAQYLFIPAIVIPIALVNSNLNALLSKLSNKDDQGVALGILGSISALISGIAPLVGGFFISHFGYIFLFMFGSISAVIAFLYMRSLQK